MILMIKLLNNICACCLKRKNYSEGEKAATGVLELDPSNFKANFNKARCLYELE